MRTFTSPQSWRRQGFLPPKIEPQQIEQTFEAIDDTDETDAIADFRRASQTYRAHVRTHRREQ